jgi:hypothetical protein
MNVRIASIVSESEHSVSVGELRTASIVSAEESKHSVSFNECEG